MTRAPIVWALCVLAITTTVPAAAQPALSNPVNDFAKVLDEPNEREIDRRIRALKRATGDIVVVATVQTFQPYADIEEYAVKMFENGGKGIGERGKDNGLLIVVAIADREARIEVGYDVEGLVTDGFAGQAIRDTLRPAFRQQRYGEGLLATTTRIINRIAEGRGVKLTEVPAETPVSAPAQGRRSTNSSDGVRVLLFILFIIFMISRRSRRRGRHWGGGSWSGWNSGVGPFGGGMGGFGGGFGGFGGGGGGGGGFGGFGGGRSGGGGASGGW